MKKILTFLFVTIFVTLTGLSNVNAESNDIDSVNAYFDSIVNSIEDDTDEYTYDFSKIETDVEDFCSEEERQKDIENFKYYANNAEYVGEREFWLDMLDILDDED